MDDVISRQAAIERFDYIRPRDPMTSDYTHGIDVGIALCKVAIREQPPAQLGTNLAEVGTDCISRQAAIDALRKMQTYKLFSGDDMLLIDQAGAQTELMLLPSAQPKSGQWILDQSGAYCCSECMEPCAGYVMMRPRDKFCKMCGSRNEVTE